MLKGLPLSPVPYITRLCVFPLVLMAPFVIIKLMQLLWKSLRSLPQVTKFSSFCALAGWSKVSTISSRSFTSPFFSISRHLQERNRVVHDDTVANPHVTLEQVYARAKETNTAFHKDPEADTMAIQVSWKKPRAGTIKLNVDGAVRNNGDGTIGPAAVGGVLRDHLGRWLTGFAQSVAPTTPLGAELLAIRKGLEVAIQQHIQDVELECDSTEAVDSVRSGTISHSYYDQITSTRTLQQTFRTASIKHVLREANHVADGLAQLGFHQDFQAQQEPNQEIQRKIMQDSLGRSWTRVT